MSTQENPIPLWPGFEQLKPEELQKALVREFNTLLKEMQEKKLQRTIKEPLLRYEEGGKFVNKKPDINTISRILNLTRGNVRKAAVSALRWYSPIFEMERSQRELDLAKQIQTSRTRAEQRNKPPSKSDEKKPRGRPKKEKLISAPIAKKVAPTKAKITWGELIDSPNPDFYVKVAGLQGYSDPQELFSMLPKAYKILKSILDANKNEFPETGEVTAVGAEIIREALNQYKQHWIPSKEGHINFVSAIMAGLNDAVASNKTG